MKEDRRRAYDRRLREAGYKTVHVWVPAEDVDRLKAVAAELRKRYQESRNA